MVLIESSLGGRTRLTRRGTCSVDPAAIISTTFSVNRRTELLQLVETSTDTKSGDHLSFRRGSGEERGK